MILLAAAVLLLWRAVLWDGAAPLFGNALFFYHPLVTAVTRQLQAGRAPLWNPQEFAGVPLLGDPQSGALCPTHLFFRFFDFAWGLRLALACEALLAASFAYLLARRLGLRRGSAFLAGLIFSCGGFLFSHAGLLAHTASAAYLPAALLFWSSGAGWMLGLTLALQVFGGHPFFLYMTLACGLFLRPRRPWATLARAVALGAPLAAVLLLPMRELFAESVRFGRLPIGALYTYAVTPDALWRFLTHPWWNRWADHFTGDPTITSFYIGLPALLLSLGAKSSRARAAGVWAAGGLALMLGPATPLYGFLLKAAPGLALFRYPAQWGVAAAAGLALLAGFGAHRLTGRWRAAATALVVLDLWGFLALPVTARVNPAFYRLLPEPLRFWRLSPGQRVAHSLRFFSAQMSDTLERPAAAEEAFWIAQKDALVPSHGVVFGLSELLSDNICRPRRLDELARAQLAGGSFPEGLLRRLSVSAWFDLEDGRIVAREVSAPLARLRVEPAGISRVIVGNALRLTAQAELPAPGRLVWIDSFFPGWRVWVDGRPGVLEPYETAFRAVPLSAGAHEVALRYEPRSFFLGLALALTALGLAAILTGRRVSEFFRR